METKTRTKRIALLIGINDYEFDPLTAPVKDARRMETILSSHDDGSKNFECKSFVSPDPVHKGKKLSQGFLTKEIRAFFKTEADTALFYFSGHGITDELGGYIVTHKASQNDPGVPFDNIVDLALISKIKEIVLIFDCCYSGAAASFGRFGKDITMLRSGVTILSASRHDQAALQRKDESLFTDVLCDGLQGGAADLLGEVTVAGLYTYVDHLLGRYEKQRPIFKSDVSRMHSLRTCTPKISKEILRRITDYFPFKNYEYPLDPSYEPDAKPHHAEHEAIFSDLQKFRSKDLLEPTGGEEHMYYAAMHKKGCKLTDRGKLYWELVKAGKI